MTSPERADAMWDQDGFSRHGSEAGNRERARRKMLLDEYEKHADTEPRLLLRLGDEYARLGNWDRAVYFLERYAPSADGDERCMVELHITELLRRLGQYSRSLQIGLRTLQTCEHLPQAYFSIAETCYYLQNWAAVIYYVEAGQQVSVAGGMSPPDVANLTYSWIIHYTNALYHVGRLSEALAWTQKALASHPKDPWHTQNYRFFAAALRARAAARGSLALSSGSTSAGRTNTFPTVFWHAPIFDANGYGDEARQFVLGLTALQVPVRAIHTFSWVAACAELPDSEVKQLRELADTQAVPPHDRIISIWHTPPPRFRRVPETHYHIGRTMFETDLLPADWVVICNQMDEVWVPCDFNLASFARAGVAPEKLYKIQEGIDVERFQPQAPPLPIEGRRGFNFLAIFEWAMRKGWDILLLAFVAEFQPHEDVALVLKVGTGVWSHDSMRAAAEALLQQVGLAASLPPNIVFYNQNLPQTHMPNLYRATDAFVLPTRGEAWGRPFMEAMLMGLPAIGTRWSGQLEFMADDNSYLIDCDVVEVSEAACRETPFFQGHHWAEPRITHLRQLMRLVFEDRGGARRKGLAAREHIMANFTRERVALQVRDRIMSILDRR